MLRSLELAYGVLKCMASSLRAWVLAGRSLSSSSPISGRKLRQAYPAGADAAYDNFVEPILNYAGKRTASVAPVSNYYPEGNRYDGGVCRSQGPGLRGYMLMFG